MPEVKPGETRDKYLNRCIPYIMKNEGLSQNQAIGKCEGMYNNSVKKALDSTLDTIIKTELIDILKTRIEYGGYESPEPGKDLSEKDKTILSHTYANCRKNGGDKTTCSKEAWGAVRRAGK